jgi:hypothetical protein
MSNRSLIRAQKREIVDMSTGNSDESEDEEYEVADNINPDEDLYVDEIMQLAETTVTENVEEEEELSQTLRYTGKLQINYYHFHSYVVKQV